MYSPRYIMKSAFDTFCTLLSINLFPIFFAAPEPVNLIINSQWERYCFISVFSMALETGHILAFRRINTWAWMM